MRIGFLGPSGSYTEQALFDYKNSAEKIACRSITEVFRLVDSGELDAGFVPLENIAHGPVTETLDLLATFRNRVYIADSHLLKINHGLGILDKKTPLESITQVFSRDQALQQCSQYIANNLPQAVSVSLESTSAAAKKVSAEKLKNAAVIASSQTLKGQGFHVVAKDISNVSENKTRFVVLKSGNINSDESIIKSKNKESLQGYVTAIVACPGKDRQGLLFEILEVISVKHSINLLSIHSRPDAVGGFVFHFDLEGHMSDPAVHDCLASLRNYCHHETGETAEISVLGMYHRQAFQPLPFKTIGIIGGRGRMGRFFDNFFTRNGYKVLVCDIDTDLKPIDIAKSADVILLSLPMSSSIGVINEITPHIGSGKLVVENCSIKANTLATLIEKTNNETEVLGIHTMFSGDVATIRDENVIITKTPRSGNLAQSFEDELYKSGARIAYATTDAHDKTTSYLQALIQFSLICLADVMSNSFKSKHDFDVFSTPNARRVFESMERVINQSDDLTADLQLLNDKAPELRNKFLEIAFELVSTLNQQDKKALLESISKSREFFKKDN